MKKLGNLLRKDIVLGIKDVFLLLEIVFSVVFMLVLLFLIPEDIRTEGHVYIWDRTGIIEEFVTDYVPDPGQSLGEYFVYNREDLITGITDDRNAVGLIINAAGQERYEVEMLSQPYTKDSLARFIEADMEDLMNILHPPMGRYPADVYSSVRIEAFQRGVDEVQPFNQRLLAPVIVFNIGLIGLFAMVSLIGQERMDSTLRAYRLTPSSLGLFLLSKNIVITGVSILNFSILYLPIMGFSGYLEALSVMVVTVIAMSSIGVALATFYQGPLEAIGWVFVLMLIFALPGVSLLNPVFSPGWLQAIPTFHSLFGLDAAMFPDNNTELIWRSVGILALLSAVLVPLTGVLFTSRIQKEA
jgi:hypothetical protein